MTTTTEIRNRITKLLALAQDQAGTPEGEASREKAFELMARYGVEQAQLSPTAECTYRSVELHGTYRAQQADLIGALSEALHCTCVQFAAPRCQPTRVEVFGMTHHLERVVMLFDMLRLHMLAGAQGWRPAVRRSWMMGFISSISERLTVIEDSHAADYGREGTSGALVLASDRDRALAARDERYPSLRSRSRNLSFYADAFHDGMDRAADMDLGGTRIPGQRALSGGR